VMWDNPLHDASGNRVRRSALAARRVCDGANSCEQEGIEIAAA
jgi:hypothetical protein